VGVRGPGEKPIAVARAWFGLAMPTFGFFGGLIYLVAIGTSFTWWQIGFVVVGWLLLTGSTLNTVKLYPDHLTFGFGLFGLLFRRRVPLSHVSVTQRRSTLEFCSREKIVPWRDCVTLPGPHLQPFARRRDFIDRARECSVLVFQDS
jgi:hypothetical protein